MLLLLPKKSRHYHVYLDLLSLFNTNGTSKSYLSETHSDFILNSSTNLTLLKSNWFSLYCQVYHHICLLWGIKSTEVLNWELYAYLFNKLQRTEADWFLFFNAFSFLLPFNFWQKHFVTKGHNSEGTIGYSFLSPCVLSLSLHLPLSNLRRLNPGYYNSHIYFTHSNSYCIYHIIIRQIFLKYLFFIRLYPSILIRHSKSSITRAQPTFHLLSTSRALHYI